MSENIDIMYEIAVNISYLAKHLIAAICLIILCRNFIDNKRGKGLIGIVYFFVTVLFYYIPMPIESFLVYVIAMASAFCVFVWIDRKNIHMKILLVVTFFVIRWISFAMSSGISVLLSDAVQGIASGFLDANNAGTWKFYYMEFVLNSLFDIALYGVILYFLVRKISKVLLYKQEDLGLQELCFMLIPSINGMVIYGIFKFYAAVFEQETEVSIFQVHYSLNFLWLFCYAAILVSIISTIVLYQSIRKKRDEENAMLMLENQVKDIRTHITEVEKLYTDIRGVKHDIKNHIEVINGLLAQGKMEEIREYSKELSETVDSFDFSIKTGNPVTDVIIHEKMCLAAEQNIEFVSDFYYPIDTKINAFDVSVILSNALSNAIEASKSGGYIKVSSFRNKNAYLITVENTFEGILEIDPLSGFPKTQKSDKKIHGLGLQNMKSVAAKYYGDVQLEQKEKRVKLTVMLLAVT